MIKYNMFVVYIVRVVSQVAGEILINMANMLDWSFNDKVRIQAIDDKGNGEVYYVTPAKWLGDTYISKVIRAINPICGKRLNKFTCRSMVKA